MAGRRSPQGPSISQLTSPLDSITSCRWRLRHIEFQQKARRHLVGEPEADAKKGTISITSPLARALIGKRMGANAEVATPAGIKAYRIEKVDWR